MQLQQHSRREYDLGRQGGEHRLAGGGNRPLRRNWSGLVPVPGDGRYEWDGYLPIKAKPHAFNPEEGFIATANNNLIPLDYPYRNAVGWEWADPYRFARIVEVLSSGRKLNMMDMMQLQTDVLAIPARTLVPLLSGLRSSDTQAARARQMLLNWDYRLEPTSVPSGIYVAWERRLQQNVENLVMPAAAREVLRGISLSKTIDWMQAPDGRLGEQPIAARNDLLLRSLDQAVGDMRERLGRDMSRWQYGQEKYKHVLIRHPLSRAVSAEVHRKLDVGPAPRGGYGHTLNNTGGNENQTSGASFRIVVTMEDWDKTMGTNSPGQSGDPDDPHYRNLFEMWAVDQFFPAFYSRPKIESVADGTTVLVPGRRSSTAAPGVAGH